MSILPNPFSTSATKAFYSGLVGDIKHTGDDLLTSSFPYFVGSRLQVSFFTSQRATSTPRSASPIAIPFPHPCAEPVIIADIPCKLSIFNPLSFTGAIYLFWSEKNLKSLFVFKDLKAFLPSCNLNSWLIKSFRLSCLVSTRRMAFFHAVHTEPREPVTLISL